MPFARLRRILKLDSSAYGAGPVLKTSFCSLRLPGIFGAWPTPEEEPAKFAGDYLSNPRVICSASLAPDAKCRKFPRMRWVAVILFLILAGGYALWSGLLKVPPQYNPWAPLDLTALPDMLTRYKLYRAKQNPDLCLQALRRSDIEFRALEDRAGGECPLVNIVQVSTAGVSFNHSFTASCPLAAGWEIFRHSTLQQAAEKHFNQPVTKVEHVGTYACRNVYNRERLSEHARANAIDITAFVLADGTRVTVERDWNNDRQSQKAAFLRDVHQGACRAFNVVFGPDYNAAHANHFHFDMGGFWACR